ncbi:MAG: KH domain-containing protein [Firmicutes bacterium]|nr:KH domain-containing protein [Bacillota bacterium]
MGKKGKEQDYLEIKNFLQGLLDKMQLGLTVSTDFSEDIVFKVEGKDVGAIIGHRGDVLDALQLLTNQLVPRKLKRVNLDVADYRARRQDTLKRLALSVAARVEKTGKRVELEAMTSTERKVIHASLEKNPNVYTVSEGEDPDRFLVVLPTPKGENVKQLKKDAKSKDKAGDKNKKGKASKTVFSYKPSELEDVVVSKDKGASKGKGARADKASGKKKETIKDAMFIPSSLVVKDSKTSYKPQKNYQPLSPSLKKYIMGNPNALVPKQYFKEQKKLDAKFVIDTVYPEDSEVVNLKDLPNRYTKEKGEYRE